MIASLSFVCCPQVAGHTSHFLYSLDGDRWDRGGSFVRVCVCMCARAYALTFPFAFPIVQTTPWGEMSPEERGGPCIVVAELRKDLNTTT